MLSDNPGPAQEPISVDGARYAIVDGELEHVGVVGDLNGADEEPFFLPDGHVSVDGARFAIIDGEWKHVGATGPSTKR
jgi:hypothetical protein